MNGGGDGGDGCGGGGSGSGGRSLRQHTRREAVSAHNDACEARAGVRGVCAEGQRRGRGRESNAVRAHRRTLMEVDDSKQRQEEHRSEERCPAHPRVSRHSASASAAAPPCMAREGEPGEAGMKSGHGAATHHAIVRWSNPSSSRADCGGTCVSRLIALEGTCVNLQPDVGARSARTNAHDLR